MPLARGEERQVADARPGVGRRAAEESDEALREAACRRPIEEVGAIDEAALPPVLLEPEREVELRRPRISLERAERQTGKGGGGERRVLQHDHRLQEGRAAEAPLGSELLDQLLVGEVLVRVGGEGDVAHAGEELPERRLAGEIEAQDEGVDESADQALELAPQAVGDRRAEDQVLLAAMAGEEDAEGGEKGHERRDRLAPSEGGEPGRGRRRDGEGMAAAAVARRRRTGPVGRQLDNLRRAGQPLAPEGEMARQALAPHQLPLPYREIGVLDRELRERRRAAGDERRVEGRHLAHQDAERPAVRRGVVEGERDRVLLPSQPHQGGAQQRSARQVERLARQPVEGALRLHRPRGERQADQVDHRQDDGGRRRDHLSQRSGTGVEGRPQGLVPADDLAQHGREGGDREAAGEPEGDGIVVGSARGVELGEKPQALLSERERQLTVPVDRRERRQGRSGMWQGRLDLARQPGHRGRLEERPQRHLDAEGLAQAGEEPGGEQRVAAEGEEAVVDGDPLDLEDLGEESGEHLLDRGARPVSVRLPRRLAHLEPRQGEAVHLAVRGQRQGGKEGDGGRDHRFWQAVAEEGEEPVRLRRSPGARRDGEGEEPRLPRRRAAHHGGRLPHSRMSGERGLDLAELDADAAELDLLVGAAEVLERSVRPPAGEIAGVIEPGTGDAGEGIGQEALGGQVGPSEIAAGEPHPRDDEPAGGTRRQRPQAARERCHQVDLRVGDRTADRHRLGSFPHFVRRRPDGRFGRPIEVDQPTRQRAQSLAGQRSGQGLAAEEEGAQTGERPPSGGAGDDRPQRRGRALQQSRPMAHCVRGERRIRRRLEPGAGQILELGERGETLEDGFLADAKVDQAGDLVDPDAAQPLDHVEAAARVAEQGAGLEIAVESDGEEVLAIGVAHRRVERQAEAPRQVGEQAERRAEVFGERPADRRPHRFPVGADEGVEHEGDPPRLGVVAVGGARLTVGLHPRGDLLDGLAEQVGEDVRPQAPGARERLVTTGGGDPDGDLRLQRPRQDAHLDLPPAAAADRHGLAPPEPPHGLDAAVHDLLAVGVVLGAEGEVVGVPAGGEGDADAPVRQVVDDRPLLGDAQRVVQGQNHAPGADVDVLGQRRQGRAGDRRIGIEAAEGMEVALGRPHRGKAVGVGELCPFEQEPILAGSRLRPVAREVEEAEGHRPGALRARGGGPGDDRALAEEDDLGAAAERPEELEHRDVEADAGGGEEAVAGPAAHGSIHPEEEIDHAVVTDRDPLGAAGGSRGIEDVGEVVRRGELRRPGGPAAVAGARLRRAVEQQERAGKGREAAPRQPLLGQEHLGTAVLEHQVEPLAGIRRIERHVGPARLEHGEERHDHLRRALGVDPHPHLGPDPQRAQAAGQAVGPSIEVGVGEALGREGERRSLRRAPRLRREELVDATIGYPRNRGVVPFRDELPELPRAEEGQVGDPRLRRRGEPAEERLEAAPQAGDRGGVEEIGVIGQAEGELAGGERRHGKLEVELGARRGERHRLEGEPAECQARPALAHREGGKPLLARQALALETAQRLEDRRTPRVALGRQPLGEERKGECLVREGAEQVAPGAGEELATVRIAAQISGEHHRIDEVADDPSEIGRTPPRGRGADQHLVLAAGARQQRREAGDEGHEQSRPLAAAERLEALDEVARQPLPLRGAAQRLHARPRPVGRQLEHLRPAGERLPPIVPEPLSLRPGEESPFAPHVVGVGRGEGRERGGVARGGVERSQLGQENTERPEVRHQVMDGDDQDVLPGR